MPTPILRRFFFASGLLAAALARGQLAATSPFMPPQGARDGAVPTADAPLEFRGVAELPDGPSFRVVDPTHKIGSWVRLNERDPDLGVTVKQHDPDRDTVTVEREGRTFTLALHQSKVASSGAAMTNAMAMPLPIQVPTIAAMAQRPAAAPLQQTQIDAVAAAVAQRRALRDQAAQQIGQGVPIAPPAIQQQQLPRAPNAAANPAQASQSANNAPRGQNQQRNNRQP